MNWMKEMGDVLSRYDNTSAARPPASVDSDYDIFAQKAPPAAISEGLSAAFRSEQTPEFPQMASQMFGRSSGTQRAGMLNALLASVGPIVLQQILARRARTSGTGTGPTPGGGMGGALGEILGGRAGGGSAGGMGGGLGDILGNILRGDGPPKVTPEVAEQITPQEVEEIAREAEKKDPGVIDRISDVYARQPELLKVIGGAALAIALGKMAQKRNTL
jgi:hypothetical protein